MHLKLTKLKLTKLKVINFLTFFLTFNVLISYYPTLVKTM